MERITFQNSKGLNLVGVLHPSPSASCIVMAHGFSADKSSKGRFEKAAHILNSLGHAVFRFDFSGCGESDDALLCIEAQVDDMSSAIRCLRERGFTDLALYGHSLGSLVCLRACDPSIRAMVLTGALTAAIQYDWSSYYSPQQLEDMEKNGYLTDLIDSPWRTTVKIAKDTFRQFETIDQEALLSRIKCPVLIIHGNNRFSAAERLLLERSRRGMKYLSPESRLVILDGAGHNFIGYLNAVINLSAAWFITHLPNKR